ncbi:hypothetical protein [uncultured Limnobacter sp.]|uniref:hypothetical protein n=1 Tax=uncultured Limnobacter sp. TaxID=199681 RepID=UPI0030FABDE8
MVVHINLTLALAVEKAAHNCAYELAVVAALVASDMHPVDKYLILHDLALAALACEVLAHDLQRDCRKPWATSTPKESQ